MIDNSILFRGNWATLIIPWNSDNTIDSVSLREEIQILIDSKVDGIYSCGTAGEFHLLYEHEFFHINEILSEECIRNNFPFQIGVSHYNPYQSLERINVIKKLKPTAIQLIAPDWWYSSVDLVIRFLNEVAIKTNHTIPLVLYNPPHAKKVYSIEEIAQIKKIVPMLKGIKVLGGNIQWYKNMNTLLGNTDLSVFIPGHTVATGIKQGAHGAYSNVCCINPTMTQQWTNAIMQSKWKYTLDIEQRLQMFMKQAITPFIDRGIPNYIMDRIMAVIGNWGPIKEIPRWPYQGISKKEILDIRNIAKDIIPEFL